MLRNEKGMNKNIVVTFVDCRNINVSNLSCIKEYVL